MKRHGKFRQATMEPIRMVCARTHGQPRGCSWRSPASGFAQTFQMVVADKLGCSRTRWIKAPVVLASRTTFDAHGVESVGQVFK